jgi:hypothetical protein
VNQDIAVVSRQEGGLGMIDIRSICHAFQTKWLRLYLDNRDCAWKSFFAAELSLQPAAHRFGLGTRLLLAHPTPTWHNMSPFWHHLITATSQLHLTEQFPTSFEDVSRQHLFLNRHILDQQHQPLCSLSMQHTASLNVTHVSHYDDIDHNNVPKISANRIKRAIPLPWIATLAKGPSPPLIGEFFSYHIATPLQQIMEIQSITQQDVHCLVLYISEHGNVIRPPIPPIRIISKSRFNLQRVHVITTSSGEDIATGGLSSTPLIANQLSIDQVIRNKIVTSPISTITVNATTKALTHYHQSVPDFNRKWLGLIPRRNWRRVLKWVWSRHRNKKVNDLIWKFLHRRLTVGENRTYAYDVSCVCGDQLETHEHLFFECSISIQFWRWFCSAWRRTSNHIIPRNIIFIICIDPTVSRS